MQAHCRGFRAKNRDENIVLDFIPEYLRIGISSLMGTHCSSVFLSSLEARKDISLSRLLSGLDISANKISTAYWGQLNSVVGWLMLLLSPGGSRVCFAWSTQGILSAIWLQYNNLKRTSASGSCGASDHCQEQGTSEMCVPGTRKILFESLLRMTSRRKAAYAKKKMDWLRICHK